MEIPETVRILGFEWAVKQGNREAVKSSPFYESGNLGACDRVGLEIHIASDLSDGRKTEVLLHEVIHAIDYAFGLDFEEPQVDRLAHGLLAVMRDNPSLTAALAGIDLEEGASG